MLKRFGRILAIVLAVLALVILVGPFLVPAPPLDTVPPQELAGPDSRFVMVTVRGIEVAVHTEVMGEGEPVFVLLHGFAASTFSWREVMGPLSERGTAIAIDWMPYGLTERPMPEDWAGETPYARGAQVELVIGVMDALGVEQAILVGNSAGGALAALTAYEHPDRVEALILVDPAIFVDGGDGHGGGFFGLLSSPLARAIGRTPQMRRLGPLMVRSIQDWGVEFGRSAWHNPDLITEETWEGYLLPMRADNWDRALYEAVIAGDDSVDLAAHLDAFTLPTLVITGDDDRIVPTDNSIRLAAALPNAELVVVEECGHIPHEERPEAFLEAFVAFLGGLGME